MFTFKGRRYKHPGGAFDLSTGCIDLEDGDMGKAYLTVIPMSPRWGVAKVHMIEYVSSKIINFVFVDDYKHVHVLTVEMTEELKPFIFDQIAKLYQSGLIAKVEVKYL